MRRTEKRNCGFGWRRFWRGWGTWRVGSSVQRYYYGNHNQLRRHLADFVNAYNFGHRLKTLKGLTPYGFIRRRWTSQPERFNLNPLQQMPGLNA